MFRVRQVFNHGLRELCREAIIYRVSETFAFSIGRKLGGLTPRGGGAGGPDCLLRASVSGQVGNKVDNKG
jgi:hypothetical protein